MTLKNIFQCKSVESIQSESKNSHLKRTLSVGNLINLGIGCIIGAGIFALTGQAAAEHAGPALMLSFVFTGIACGFVGLCYAELSSVLPVSGSSYTYAYATLGEIFAWVMGCLLVLEYGMAAATVAVSWSGYLNSFLLGAGCVIPPELLLAKGQIVTISDAYHGLFIQRGYEINEANQLLWQGNFVKGIINLPAVLVVLCVTTLLCVGISESAKVNNVIVAIKLAVVIAFIGIGVFYIDVNNWTPFIPENQGEGIYGWSGVFRAASIIFFAYVGFEAVSTAAQEAKNPQKDMPIGIIGALLICTLLYIAVSGVLTGIVPYTKLNVPDPMAVAVDAIGLPWFALLIKIGAIMGLSSVMLVLIYGQTRIFYVMSQDGLLPPVFSKTHSQFQTPIYNTVFVGIAVAITAGFTPISTLGDLVSLGTLIAFMIVCFSVIYLRYTRPDLQRPFKTPFVPFVPLIGMVMCGYLVVQMPLHIFIKLKLFFIVGLAVYVFYGYKHSKIRQK